MRGEYERSPGKKVARDIFYLDTLRRSFTTEELKQIFILVLLGRECLECDLIDNNGIPRHQVISIERKLAIYYEQRERQLGVNLYHEEVVDFLKQCLHRNQRLQVLNLDIEGSYYTHLESAMTAVLLFCWRNPKTVVATYNNLGRDEGMLWEGVKSLAIFLSIEPILTEQVILTLYDQYVQARLRNPIGLVLRDMFWLRSIMEHNLRTSALLGLISHQDAENFFTAEEEVWRRVKKTNARRLRLEHLRQVAKVVHEDQSLIQRLTLPEIFGLVFTDQQNVLYKSNGRWTQRCWYSRFGTVYPYVDGKTWLQKAFISFTADPMTFIDRNGKKSELRSRRQWFRFLRQDTLLFGATARLFSFSTRTLAIKVDEQLDSTLNILLGEIKKRTTKKQSRKTQYQPMVDEFFDLTAYGKKRVKELAGQGMSNAEITRELRLPAAMKWQVNAHLAVARRNKHFVISGVLTDYGHRFIQALAARKLPFDEIRARTPKIVTDRMIQQIMTDLMIDQL